MPKNIEVIFDETSGNFAVHYSNYSRHDEEHAETDRIVEQLKAMGFEVTLHFDGPSKPKCLPEDVRDHVHGPAVHAPGHSHPGSGRGQGGH